MIRKLPYKWAVAISLLLVLAALVSQVTPSVAGQLRAQSSDPIANPILATTELAAFEALARGDTDGSYALLLSLLSGATSEPPSDRSATIAELLLGVIEEGGLFRRAVADLRDLPHAPDVLRIMGECARATGDDALLSFVEQALGCIPGWMVCGPFDNERGSGFSVSHLARGFEPPPTRSGVSGRPEPVSEPEFTAGLVGKAGRAIQWRAVPVNARLGYLDLNTIVRPNDHAMAYAFSVVHAPEATVAELAIASDEGVRVWLNGVELIMQQRGVDGSLTRSYGAHVHRESTFDQHRWTVPLAAGVNRLMVKCLEEEGAWGFSARIRGLNGVALRPQVAVDLDTWKTLINSNRPAAADGEPRSEAGPQTLTNMRDLFWAGAAELYRKRGERKDRVAMHLLRRVRDGLLEGEAGSELAAVTWLLAQAARSTAETAAGTEENERRQLISAVLRIDPQHVPALIDLSEYYTTTLSIPMMAERFARLAVEAAPGSARARLQLARTLADRGIDSAYEAACRELVAAGRGDSPAVKRYLGWILERRGATAEARTAYLAACNADRRDAHSVGKVLDYLAADGKHQEYQQLSQEVQSLNPFWIWVLTDRAEVTGRLRMNQPSALKILEEAIEISPQDDDVLVATAQMAMRVALSEDSGRAEGYRNRAIGWYNAALVANPGRSDVRRYLSYLVDDAPLIETAFLEDAVPMVRQAMEESFPTDAPARVVWYDDLCQVSSDGTSVRSIHFVVQVTNEAGSEMLRMVPAFGGPDSRVLTARVHRRDGTTEQSRVSSGMVTNPPIGVGDCLELRFRISDDERGFFGDTYGDIGVMAAPRFGGGGRGPGLSGMAVSRIRRGWMLPDNREYTIHRANGAPEPKTFAGNGNVTHLFEVSGIPRTEAEPAQLPQHHSQPTVYVSSFSSWTEFGAWYWNLIERQMVSTPAIASKVAELTDGLETEQEKVRAVYHWVVTEIRYNANWEFGVHGYKPYEAGAIFDRCIGDCKDKAILIVTMLREAGITAWPVLINAEDFRGREDLTAPMPHHFNHAIARVDFSDGSSRYIDGTATYVAWHEGLPSMDAGARVLVVKPGGGELDTIPPHDPRKNWDNWEVEIELSAGGDSSLAAHNRPLGASASRWRQSLEIEGDRQRIVSQLIGRILPGSTVEGVTAEGIGDLTAPVEWAFTAGVKGHAQAAGGSLTIAPLVSPLVPVPWSQTGWGMMASRKTDMVLLNGLGERQVVTVRAPEGFVAGNLPAAVKVETAGFFGSISYQLSEDGRAVTVTREWGMTESVVPVADYPAFREALLAMDQGAAARLTFRKG